MLDFFRNERPPLTAMVSAQTPEDAIAVILNSHYDGAEAFYIQLELLRQEYWNKETLSRIFEHCRQKPIIVTAYRFGHASSCSDEDRAALLLLGLESGASVCDMMGDLFHPEENQLTFNAQAVEKQEALINQIHKSGGKVLISSHLNRFFTKDEVCAFAKAQEKRGADICKIVSKADSEDQLLEDLSIAAVLKKEIQIPYLFLANGAYSKLLRLAGANLGVCMYLCVQHFSPLDFRDQPRLRETAAIRSILL